MKPTLHSGRNPTWSRYVSPGCLDPALPGLSTCHSHSVWSQRQRKENRMVGGEEPPACSRAAALLESLPGQALIFPRPPLRSPLAPSSAHRGTGPSPFLYGQRVGCLSQERRRQTLLALRLSVATRAGLLPPHCLDGGRGGRYRRQA